MKCRVLYTKEADEFLVGLPEGAKKKLLYSIAMVEGGVKDTRFFKKLAGHEIWEFRAEYRGVQYRLLAFWDSRTDTYIVATHGFVKKSQKTPDKEIERAEAIMKEYFSNK